MKAVILAGGRGTRMVEETATRPKPMVEVGGRPLLWHILKTYASHGITDFVVCCGYRGYIIKEYFANYFLHTSDATFDLRNNTMEVHQTTAEPWRVTLVDTGIDTQTGGRLRRVRDHLAGEDVFCFTYGDGISNVDITRLVEHHRRNGLLATITAVQPPGRFGALQTEGDRAVGFLEKPQGDGQWINGGYFVLSPEAISYIAGDDTIWEDEPLTRLAAEGQLGVYRHGDFWQPVDTLRELHHLEHLWQTGSAPWKVW